MFMFALSMFPGQVRERRSGINQSCEHLVQFRAAELAKRDGKLYFKNCKNAENILFLAHSTKIEDLIATKVVCPVQLNTHTRKLPRTSFGLHQ